MAPVSFSNNFPPKPKFTEKELADQSGKVFIVTGASAGVGKALAQILYSHNAKVYVAARSEERAAKVISDIRSKFPSSTGHAIFLNLDLDDLATVKNSADEFLAKEDRLDVLWNNAGVMAPPKGSRTKQDHELQLGTNNIAPFLFTKLLTPLLIKTAKVSAPSSVRVVWVSSSMAELTAPRGGVPLGNLDYKKDEGIWYKYGVSKAGNYLHSMEFAKRHKADGIVSVSLNPGNLRSDLLRHLPGWQVFFLKQIQYEPIYGAYTELFAGLSPNISIEQTGAWVQPWGRLADIRRDISAAAKSTSEGGSGVGEKFWEWTELQVKLYL